MGEGRQRAEAPEGHGLCHCCSPASQELLVVQKGLTASCHPCRLVLHYFPVTALLPTRSTQVPPAKPQEHSRELREKVLPPGPGANIHLYTEVVCTPG